jgi:hypothetical protein
MFLLKLCFIPMLWKVLSKTGKPLWCAIIYALAIWTNGLLFDLMMGASTPAHVLGFGVLETAAGALYFYVLHELDGADGLYYLWMALGLFGLLYIPS